MSKLAGVKGRSPETYPSAVPFLGFKIQSRVNPSTATLGTSLTTILTSVVDVLPGNSVVTFSGSVSASASCVVTVDIVLDGAPVFSVQQEVTTTNSPVPINLSLLLDLSDTPDPHTVDIQAKASLASTATISVGSSLVVLYTAT